MKTSIVGLGLTMAAMIASPAGAAAHDEPSVSGTGKPPAALSRATRQAVGAFVDAYATRDPAGLDRTTTADFEVRFGLAQTGTYVSLDEDALLASWRDAGLNSFVEHSTVAIFPTLDSHAVFVTYRVTGIVGSERIALLELRGARVARAHDLIAPVPARIARAAALDGMAIAATVSVADAQRQAQEVLVGHRSTSPVASTATPQRWRSASPPTADVQQQAADIIRGQTPDPSRFSTTRLALGTSRTPLSGDPRRLSNSQDMAKKVMLGRSGE